jgi:transposase
MSYTSDLTDEQWALLEPVFNAPGKHGPKHAADLRSAVDAKLYISHTGCQWRFLPESFGPWTRVCQACCVVGAGRHHHLCASSRPGED